MLLVLSAIIFLFARERPALSVIVVQLDATRKAFQSETVENYQEYKANSVPVKINFGDGPESNPIIKKRAE